MGQVKTIQSRIQFKMDTIENWEGFVPEKGELCICSNFEDTGLLNKNGNKIYKPSFKIGVGNNQLFESLAFLPEEPISNEAILTLFNSTSATNTLDEAFLDSIILD